MEFVGACVEEDSVFLRLFRRNKSQLRRFHFWRKLEGVRRFTGSVILDRFSGTENGHAKVHWIRMREELDVIASATDAVKVELLARGVFLPFGVVIYACLARMFAIRQKMLLVVMSASVPKGVVVPKDPEQMELERIVYADTTDSNVVKAPDSLQKRKDLDPGPVTDVIEEKPKAKKKKKKISKGDGGDDIDSIFSLLD